METGKWIKVDAFIDTELDEILISFSGPTGGAIYPLTDNLDAMLDMDTDEVMGFSLQGFLEGSKATQQPREVDGATLCANCGEPRKNHSGKGQVFCNNRPTTYANRSTASC